MKLRAKVKALAKIRDLTGIDGKPEALLDVQVCIAQRASFFLSATRWQ